MNSSIAWFSKKFDAFLFESCSPNTCVLLRICYSSLAIVYTVVFMLDGPRWFSDEGVISADSARGVLDSTQWSLFFSMPASPALVTTCLWLLLLSCVLMLLGVFSRFQAALIFFWLLSFQHRNPLVCDGEDTVFRLFAFFLIFLPLDHSWSLGKRALGKQPSRSGNAISTGAEKAWGLRLFHVQMAFIYFSAAWSKAIGTAWQDGSALYYVYQMGDLFGRGPLPEFLTQSETAIRYSTWAVVALEAALPLCLWFRPTRKFGILLGIGLHLTMEYAMHLFLFQWIMIVGVLSFVDFKDWGYAARSSPKTDANEPLAAAIPPASTIRS